eukprot:GHVU01030239.1.p2 GENE.GHVU01030239.1~~GHVU01030239.1.p2  ORF type:complete len:113 (-),score=8.97 GHVU01030239.1:378-716(-)
MPGTDAPRPRYPPAHCRTDIVVGEEEEANEVENGAIMPPPLPPPFGAPARTHALALIAGSGTRTPQPAVVVVVITPVPQGTNAVLLLLPIQHSLRGNHPAYTCTHALHSVSV